MAQLLKVHVQTYREFEENLIYQDGKFPDLEKSGDAKYKLYANTRWSNAKAYDCNQYKIGTFENLDDARKIMYILTSGINPYAPGRIFVLRDTVEFEK